MFYVAINAEEMSSSFFFPKMFSNFFFVGNVQLLATGTDGSKEVVTHCLRPRIPTIFEFCNLSPGTKYTVDILGPEPQPYAKQAFLTTLPEERNHDFRIATLSCNNVFRGTCLSSTALL